MQRLVVSALVLSAVLIDPAIAGSERFYVDTGLSGQSAELSPNAPRRNLGGGLIEFLFGGRIAGREAAVDQTSRQQVAPAWQQARAEPAGFANWSSHLADPRYERQVVAYRGNEKPGTIVIDTHERLLYLVAGDGKAIRYGIGVGRPGFAWSGVKEISMKREWPDWTPPDEMLRRRPDLPRYMPGGPENPLGARALYLGSSLYRIHGSNEPWTIGTQVSSGCIRMRNEDVIDLYQRVKVGTKVVVI